MVGYADVHAAAWLCVEPLDMTYGFAAWPLGCAGALLLGAALLQARTRRRPAQGTGIQRSLVARPLAERTQSIVCTILVLFACKAMLFATSGYFLKTAGHEDYDERFYWQAVIAFLGVVFGVALSRGSSEQRGLALVGALGFALHGHLLGAAGRLPKLDEHNCKMVQTGRACALLPRSPFLVDVEGSGGATLRGERIGSLTKKVAFRKGLAFASGDVKFRVGEDRGNRLFSPRPFDVWRFRYEESITTAVLASGDHDHGTSADGQLNLYAREGRIAHGRRWLRLGAEYRAEGARDGDKEGIRREMVWAFFLDGETYLAQDQGGEPSWHAYPAINRPDLEALDVWREQKVPELSALESGEMFLDEMSLDGLPSDLKMRMARTSAHGSALGPLTTPCEFVLFGLSCRCADRGIGPARTLPGPVSCWVGSSGLSTVGLLLLSGFTVYHASKTTLLATRSNSEAGLAPPQPPIPHFPDQAAYEKTREERRANREKDARQRRLQPYEDRVRAAFRSAQPAMRACLEQHLRRGVRVRQLSVLLHVMPDGQVADESMVLSTQGAALDRCLTAILKRLPYPPDELRDHVGVSLRLNPEQD